MEIGNWLLWVVGFLWLITAGLIAMGIREIIVGVKLLKIAQVTHATDSVAQLRDKLEAYGEQITGFKNDALRKFDPEKYSPEDIKRLNQYIERITNTETEIAKDLNDTDQDLESAYKAGIKRSSTGFIEQTNATKSFALAAAYFAGASIAIGINSIFMIIF
jgi:hypothetical protein